MPPPKHNHFVGEDKWLMSIRNKLELAWANRLFPDDRAAWLERWQFFSPRDIANHVYTPYTPAKFTETKVAPETAYAWSQIYGVARFNRPIVVHPTLALITSPQATHLDVATGNFTIDYHSDWPVTKIDIQVYATGPSPHGPNSRGRRALKPMCHMPRVPTKGTLDFTDCWLDRFGLTKPLALDATVALVNANNELVPSLDLLTAFFPPH